MESHLLWALAGIALVIVELLTGTLYLMIIGIAAFAGSAIAYFNYSFWTQAVCAAAIALVGVMLVNRYRAMQPARSEQSLDIGQSVMFDSWVSEADGMARVKYRNALWDAKFVGERGPADAKLFYICAVDGNTLHISASKPA